jgi:hypothetical protein
MELLCPNCQQKLTIPDQYAGQLMRCPLCNGTFTAPALAPPPPPPAVAPEPEAHVYSLGPAPSTPPPPPPFHASAPIEAPPPAPAPPSPPLPPGDLTHSFAIAANPGIVPWLAPAGLFLILFLSFLPWIPMPLSWNAWTLGFGERSDTVIGLYLLLTVVAFALSIPSCLFGLNLAPVPPALHKLMPWRPVIVGGVALLAFVFLFYRYIDAIFSHGLTPGTIWLKLAFRIHVVVIIGSLLEFWLEMRRGRNLPPPRLEVKW